jgi:hypothetical protein
MGTPARGGLPIVDRFDERDPLHWIAVGGTRQMRHNRSYARGSAPCRRSRSASQRLEFHNGRALVSEGCPAPTLRGRRRSATRRSSRIKGISSSERDVATADLPPFTTARCISAAATGLSCWQTTTSTKLSIAKRKGADIAFASRYPMPPPAQRRTFRDRDRRRRGPCTTNPLF